MKHQKKTLLAAALLVPFFTIGLVRADTDTTRTDNSTAATERKTGNENLNLQQRLEKYKTELKTRLTNAQKQRLQTRCKAAQGKVSSLTGRLKGLETSRDATYSNLLSHLDDLIVKLDNNDTDNTVFKNQVAGLKTMIDTFQTDLAKYREATDDLVQQDCAADPDAFRAALESARTHRAQVVKDGQAIRAYLKDTIKPTLQEVRTRTIDTSGEEQ